MKKIVSFMLMIGLALTLAAPAFAIESAEVTMERIDLGNGDFITVTTSVSPQNARNNYRTAVQTYEYTFGGKVVWAYTLEAQFTYDFLTAKAVNAWDSYRIYDSNWSCVSRNPHYSGATAYGYGYFKTSTSGYVATPTLTCSPDGIIS